MCHVGAVSPMRNHRRNRHWSLNRHKHQIDRVLGTTPASRGLHRNADLDQALRDDVVQRLARRVLAGNQVHPIRHCSNDEAEGECTHRDSNGHRRHHRRLVIINHLRSKQVVSGRAMHESTTSVQVRSLHTTVIYRTGAVNAMKRVRTHLVHVVQ